MRKEKPIGIFDSGIGGLTVAAAVNRLLPHEQIIYFGDIAHLPYGDKSTAAIQAYAVKICDFLIEHSCKVILIACNSASAAAYELAKEYTGSRAKVISVIDPAVDFITENYANKTIGLIGTKQTVGSRVYETKIAAVNNAISVRSMATPLLVPMIEEGLYDNKISHEIINEYLSNPQLKDIEALILGCTHYPVIKREIETYYQGTVKVIDSASVVASSLAQYLYDSDLNTIKRYGENRFFVSDVTPSFETATSLFFNDKVLLEKHVLWE